MKTAHFKTKPFRSYHNFLQERFGCRVYKITVDAGFTCPNRDGTKGSGGCTFCDPSGSSSYAQDRRDFITTQILNNIETQRQRVKAEKFIAYFQSFTNTYSPAARLKKLYDEALSAHPDVIGLAISTRPDCVDEEKLALIASYQHPDRYISVEYGMQTIHNHTLKQLNRCETHEDFLQAYTLTRQYGLSHCIHVILGLPGESWEDQMATARTLAQLGVEGVKIHLLCAMRNTPLADQYYQGQWHPWGREESITLICDFLERLRPDCVIHRLAGNGHYRQVVAPLWLQKKFEFMNAIELEFQKRGTAQGSLYQS